MPADEEDVRCRLRFMTLNVGGFVGDEKLIERYVNDQKVHIVVLTESNVAKTKQHFATPRNYTLTECCPRRDGNLTGGGDGGILMFSRFSVPCLRGFNVGVTRKNEMEHRPTTL